MIHFSIEIGLDPCFNTCHFDLHGSWLYVYDVFNDIDEQIIAHVRFHCSL